MKRPPPSLRALVEKRAGKAPLAIGHPDPDRERGLTQNGVITIPYSARSAHLHVVGRTRSGKSRFIADLIRQDISAGHGLCLIDPHGELYDLTVNWLAQNPRVGAIRKHIHPVRFTDPANTFKYNPLAIEHPDEAYSVASNVTNAITRIYGGKDSTETPLTWFVLDVTCTILALRGLPLAAAKYFLLNDSFSRELREKISDGLPNEYYRQLGLEFSRLSPREFRETVGSTGRRLHQFLKNPFVERIFSNTENTASLSRVMDDRHILLLDTSDQGGLIDFDQLRTIGMLMVNNLFATARKRDPKLKPTPFFLYIDEAQNYLSDDIEHILSEAAKRGLYLTLSHQYLGQLMAASDEIYKGVMSGTLMKAVFGVTMDDADVFVDELFAEHIDFERVKEKLKTPHVVDHDITWLKNKSTSTGFVITNTNTRGEAQGESQATSEMRSHGETQSESRSESESHSTNESTSVAHGVGASEMVFVPNEAGVEPTGTMQGESASTINIASSGTSSTYASAYSSSRSSSDVYGTGSSRGTSTSTSRSTGTGFGFQTGFSSGSSEALKPVIEWFSTATYSLEEQRYDLKRRIAYQPERHGFLAVRRAGTIGFTTRHIPDPLNIPLAEQKLLGTLRGASPWIVPAEAVPRLLDHPGLRDYVPGPKTRLKDEPDDYFEPEE